MIRSLWLAVLFFAATAASAQPKDALREAEVEAAFQAIQTAAKNKDLSALQRLVDEGFVMFHGYGPSEPRDTWLKLIAAGRLARQTAEVKESNTRIRLFGDTAVRSGIVRFRRADLNQDTWLQGTAAFIRRGGAWRAISQQSTLLHEGPIVQVSGLQEYAGTYAIPNRDGFTVKDAQDYLALKWTTGAEMPLIPLGGDRFVSAYGSTMTFERDAAGKVDGVVRHGSGGRELFRAKRLLAMNR